MDAQPGAMPSEQPFPLKRRFWRWFAPGFVGFIGVFLVLVGFTARHVTESIYLELAQRRAQTIATAVSSHAPQAWAELMAGRTAADLQSSSEALMKAISDEMRELKLSELKVYDLDRKVLFATDATEIGSREDAEALHDVIDQEASDVVSKTLTDGTRQYELYVPVRDDNGQLRLVFELYEPVGYLDAILFEASVPTIAIPGVLLLALALALGRLVNRAQADIDARTKSLNDLRRRVETFVSAAAATAARDADVRGGIRSRKLVTTLFHSDIRSFTSFAEKHPAEDVVSFLNEIMALQVDAVRRYGGDVDKMIGDALLARFDGDGGAAEAIAAARDIVRSMRGRDFPRGLGIGIYRGEVIAGAIGPEDRRDFTVIGDAVNISARLCSAASAGEIVVEAALADDDFQPEETLAIKGRDEPLTIRRLRP